MARTIAINGTKLDKVQMPLEPYGNGSVGYLRYPANQIRLHQDDCTLRLVVPAYLAVELYRIGLLPQDVDAPVEISISGRTEGRYTVSDVRYPYSGSSPFGQVTFTLARVPQGIAHNAADVGPRSHSEAEGNGTYVMDITHYLDDTGELMSMPGPARKLASFLTLLIDAATGALSREDHDSGIRCRRKACRGSIQTSLMSDTSEILWQCPACGHHGVIRNWRGTKWNRLKHSEQSQ